MTCRWHVRAAMTERASSLRESILLGSTKKESRRKGGFFFAIIKGESKGAVVNDVPVARQETNIRIKKAPPF